MQGSGIKEYPNCFGCGQENPKGLGLKLRLEGDTLVTEFVPRPEHEGWPGIVSGGIILALLYEVLENQPYYAGDTPMMKCIETRLLCPAHVGESIRATITGHGQAVAGALLRPGQSEIENHRLAVVGDHQIARLDVAVDQPRLVCLV